MCGVDTVLCLGISVLSTYSYHPTKLYFEKIELAETAKSVSQVSAVCNGCVSTFSGSIFAEESKSEVGVHNGTRQCALRHILRPFFSISAPCCLFWACEGSF